ncbi:histone deacetylase family protein [Alteromonas sp. 14N.309.X.WAT.G.H12]|uniref:histone deacetylase family protein n=1 Tax=Alteromonas sp. 14N.309.X.WAT.G.H12 TaxID=3120824 RepID=UPI002FD5EB28
MTVRIFRGKDCLNHDVGHQHPECPDRLYAIDDQLLSSGLEMTCEHQDVGPCPQEYLALAHDPYYVKGIFEQAPKSGLIWVDDDTGMTPITLSAALQSAGAGIEAVDWVMAGEDRQAFCAVRPPGHHAEYDSAMGFCLFNNIAVAARYALKHHGLNRVAIVDFDVHHGNGTENIVAGDKHIMLCSSFQHPFYPHSGDPVSASNVLSVPLDAGTTGEVFREKVRHWFAVLQNYAPELILISAGFDGHAEDHMGHLRLREDDYKWISAELRKVADACCHGRMVSTLEGGYNHSALARSVVAHIKGLQGDSREETSGA